ncbi:MAG: thermosome subunit beta [Candidatus Bathyarchaeia archaeon]
MSISQPAGTPVIILKEGSGRSRGRDALHANIMAVQIVAETVRSSLGPKGMDKMLVDSLGDLTITSDGRTLLDNMDIQHPAAKMVVEVAKTQDHMVGDGTTTAVIIAGELLRKAEDLLEQKVHPTIIVKGYRQAAEIALKSLDDIAIPIERSNEELMETVARTSLYSKIVSSERGLLAKIAVEAIKQIAEEKDGRVDVDIDDVQINKKEGRSVGETVLLKGLIIGKEAASTGTCPTCEGSVCEIGSRSKRVKDAKIALINRALEIKKTEFDAKIQIRDPTKMKLFMDKEHDMLKNTVQEIVDTGATVVFCQKGIDELAQHFLDRHGVYTVHNVKEEDMKKLSRATKAKILTRTHDMKPADLGYAATVEERKVGDEKMTFVEGCKNPKAVCILIRGGGEHFIEEAERAMHDALCVVRNVIQDPKVVAGGGAPEAELARRLQKYASGVGGKEQLAIKAFAEALERIPITLAENAGLEPVDIMVELRKKHEEGLLWSGVNILSRAVGDMKEAQVYDPFKVVKQAIMSATETATMILRIDDVVSSARNSMKPSAGV